MNRIDYIRIFDKYLAHTATKEEIAMLVEWLCCNKNSNEWLDMEWILTEERINPTETVLFEKIKYKLDLTDKNVKQKSFSKIKLFVSIAAVLLLFIAIAWKLIMTEPAGGIFEDQIVNVGKGQKVNLILQDGSNVWVNSDSKLQYGKRFNAKERIVRLTGEAFFEVSSDEERPFIVETNDISVKALGTSFNVKCYENEHKITIDLLAGEVEIYTSTEKVKLEPDQRLIYDKFSNTMTKQYRESIAESKGWIRENSRLVFESETFENIVLALERKYNVAIVVHPEHIKKMCFTGPLPDNLENALKIISFSIPLNYEIHDDFVTIGSK